MGSALSCLDSMAKAFTKCYKGIIILVGKESGYQKLLLTLTIELLARLLFLENGIFYLTSYAWPCSFTGEISYVRSVVVTEISVSTEFIFDQIHIC